MLRLLPDCEAVSMDMAHAALIMGHVAASKPLRVLELGFGAGYVTDAILQALEWNQRGSLDVVDNWLDWGGLEPEHTHEFRQRGAKFIFSNEEDFLKGCQCSAYDMIVSDADMIVSDADPENAHKFAEHYMLVLKKGGTLFMHNVGDESPYKELRHLRRLFECGVHKGSATTFNASSRGDERCGRGLMMFRKD